MTERGKKRFKIGDRGIDIEFEKLQQYMTPGTVKIIKNGRIKKKKLLVAYRSDETIIIVDLNGGREIYRSE